LVSAYTTAKNAAIAAVAAAEQKTADKDDALENLTDAMKSDIRYAENKVNYDDDKKIENHEEFDMIVGSKGLVA